MAMRTIVIISAVGVACALLGEADGRHAKRADITAANLSAAYICGFVADQRVAIEKLGSIAPTDELPYCANYRGIAESHGMPKMVSTETPK